MFSSFGRHFLTNDASTFATYPRYSPDRVPVGALRLMTNCPGSVRGKKETPSKGDKARLSEEQDRRPNTVQPPAGRAPD